MTDSTRPHDLRVDHLAAPLGIGAERPRLSWKLPVAATVQHAYRIIAGDWDSHRVKSGQSTWVPAGVAPASRVAVEWKVKVWTDLGESDWSDVSSWEHGLLDRSDWTAAFMTPDWDEDTTQSLPCPWLRREFNLPGEVVSARLYITALGVYQAEINGLHVGGDILRPGWTS
ncbi:MAG: alpha-L-rhamnosidase, partial [Chloroflexi bacterium]